MDKRYQVFVSSTYRDLQPERREVIQALLEMDCIPAGMELFPAADEDAWTLIQGVIRECDYYVLIVGGRYGSTDEEGISYTEKEYDYAVEARIPVAPFLHGDPGKIPAEHSEMETAAREKLTAFRAKVEKVHHCKYWATPEDLGGKVSRAMSLLMKNKPREGWVRASQAADVKMLSEMNALRTRVQGLQEELARSRTSPPHDTEDLAKGKERVLLSFSYCVPVWCDVGGAPTDYNRVESSAWFTWDDVFGLAGPLLLNDCVEPQLRHELEQQLPAILPDVRDAINQGARDLELSDHDFHTIKIQLIALGLIQKVRARGGSQCWTLTPYGENYLMKMRAIRRASDRSPPGNRNDVHAA